MDTFYRNNVTNNYWSHMVPQAHPVPSRLPLYPRSISQCAFGLDCTSSICHQNSGSSSQYFNPCYHAGGPPGVAHPFYGPAPGAHGMLPRFGSDADYWMGGGMPEASKEHAFDMSPYIMQSRPHESPFTYDFPNPSGRAAKDTLDKKSSIYKITRGEHHRESFADGLEGAEPARHN